MAHIRPVVAAKHPTVKTQDVLKLIGPMWKALSREEKEPFQVLAQEKKAAQKIYQSIEDEGLKNNIHFQFEKINQTPNSFASHKLLAIAYKFKKQTAVVESLFYDYFIEGIDIGDFSELIRIAKLHKIYDAKSLNYLRSHEDNKSLIAEEKHARELGVKGVPCFIVNKQYVLFGAQEKSRFLDVFEKIY